MQARQQARRGRTVQFVLLSLVAVVSWLAAVYFRVAPEGAPLIRPGHAALPSASATAAPAESGSSSPAQPSSSVAVASSHSASATATAAPSTTAIATALPSASATAATTAEPAASSSEVTACVAGLFPEDTFDSGQADFGFICQATRPRRGITDVQAQVVAGRRQRGGITPGMREWSHLGWYQVAAFALLRGKCCESTAELVWSLELPCPFDEAVAKLESAIRASDIKGTEGALGYYTTTSRCLAKAGLGAAFNQRSIPGPGLATFRKLLARAKK